MRPARPAPPPPRTSRDRWLVAYADMLTLLFAVFVSLYAARIDFLPPAAASGVPAPDRAVWTDDMVMTRLRALVDVAPDLRPVELRQDARGVVISLPESGAFGAGQAELSPAARAVLRQLAPVLKATGGFLRIEGHTDDTPIHTAAFQSNWELSTARATEVLKWLVTSGGLPEQRLSAAGFGPYRPRTPNTSPEARARNRRVDLIVVSPGGAPAPRPAAVAGGGRGF